MKNQWLINDYRHLKFLRVSWVTELSFSILPFILSENKNCLYILLTLKVFHLSLITPKIKTSNDFYNHFKHAVLQMLWPTWPWSPLLTSLALLISPSLASMGSGAQPKLIWTSRETTKSSFYPNIPILKCTKGEIGWRRLETFETLTISASSTVNPHRKFPRWKK